MWDEIICLVNPTISKVRGHQTSVERCLSLPGVSVKVIRPMIITVRALNQYLKPVKYKFSGFDAVVASHEIDHLSGTLIIDYGNSI